MAGGAMMAAIALFALAQEVLPEDEIVVIGRRLAAIEVAVGRDARGKLTCALNQSSGHAALDAQLCATAAKCVKAKAPDVKACIDKRKPALLAQIKRAKVDRR